jgi:peptide/nickel transport system substrate-binding protein
MPHLGKQTLLVNCSSLGLIGLQITQMQKIICLCFTKNFSPNGPNYTHFKNNTYDVLYKEVMITSIECLRIEKYKQMDKLVMEEFPIIPLYYGDVICFI